jgi:hypothetical protein
MHGSRSKIPSKKSHPYIYGISRLRVKLPYQPDDGPLVGLKDVALLKTF